MTPFFKQALVAWALAGAATFAMAASDSATAQLNAVLWTQQALEH